MPPRWFALWTRLGVRTSPRYKIPTMPFSLTVAEAGALANKVPGVRSARDLRLPSGRGLLFNTTQWTVYRMPILDRLRPCLTLLEFG